MNYLVLLSLFLLIIGNATAQIDSTAHKDSLKMERCRMDGQRGVMLTEEERINAFEEAEKLAAKYHYSERQFVVLWETGDFYAQQKLFKEAVIAYKKAIHLEETAKLVTRKWKYARLHTALGGVLQEVEEDSNKKERLEESIMHCKIATKLSSWQDQSWLLLGNAYIRLAEEEIKSIKSNNDLEKVERKALMEAVLERYEQALLAYKKVEKIRPSNPDVERNLGLLHRDQGKVLGQYLGRLDESIVALENSIFYYKKDVESYRLLGVATGIYAHQLGGQGENEESQIKHQKALQYFEKALALKPDSVPILYNLEIAHRFLGEQEKAAAYRKKWEAIDPDYIPMNDY